MTKLPLIAVTMGDPAGVGPELCVRLLADSAISQIATPVVFGDYAVLQRAAAAIGLPLEAPASSRGEWQRQGRPVAVPAVLDFQAVDAAAVKPGVIGAHTGAASFAYVDAAIDAVLAGDVAAVATGPLSKEALQVAGHKYPGHTEIFA